MNEYTRREEIQWTLITVFILVASVAVAIMRLVVARGPMVTDPTAIEAERTAKQAALDSKQCVKWAKQLPTEVRIFKTRSAQAKQRAAEQKPGKKDDVALPWSPASSVLKFARALDRAGCRPAAASKAAAPAWAAVAKANRIADPGADANRRQAAAQKLLRLFDEAPLAALEKDVRAADVAIAARAATATETREKAKVQAMLPTGLFPRGPAIGVGVGVALAALLISYISVRSASMRRGRTLISLRRFANTPEAGLQAAAIVRLAAHHNGGEPGMVIGAALGGLIACALAPTEDPNVFIADLFVAGAMGGLLVGLAAQWLVRTVTGVDRWRARTKELGEIEKPTIPVALILGGVTPGLEKQVLRYFEAFSVADVAIVVQKLAAQAEEQILAAADAASKQQAAMAAGATAVDPTAAAPAAAAGSPPWPG
ncbi:MAG: hypothetical protein AAGN82_16335 [Myxococcota bacterium]